MYGSSPIGFDRLLVTHDDGRVFELPEPAYKGISFSIQDVDYDSGRMMDGTMARNRVARKRKISVTWPPMTPGKVANVLGPIADESFILSVYDVEAGGVEDIKVYVGDRTVPYINANLGEVTTLDDGTPIYSGLCDSFTVSFVEY